MSRCYQVVILLLLLLAIAVGCGPVEANEQSSSARADRPITDKWALIVGITEFPSLDLGRIRLTTKAGKPSLAQDRSSLQYCVKDAIDFENFLVDKAGFKPDHVRLLINPDATGKKIRFYLGDGWLKERVKPDDLVFIYFSSHGTGRPVTDENGENYIVTYDFDPKNAEATGISMQQLGDLVKSSIKSDRVVIVADTCHAANIRTRGREKQELIGFGQISLTACSADETSLDDGFREGGLFTSYLIKSLEKNNGALKKSFDETRDSVIRAAHVRLSEQHPVVDYSRWTGSDAVLFAKPTNPVD